MKYLTSGESHGKCIDIIVSDVPSGINISENDINYDLSCRSKGYGRSVRQDKESNECQITSGINNGKTTGNPIHIQINNICTDYDKENIDNYFPRPGHADLNGMLKYNSHDFFNISERASARETAVRICVGTIAKNFLAMLGAEVYSYVISVGSVSIKENANFTIENLPTQTQIAMSEVKCPDLELSKLMMQQIDRAKLENDTIGGCFRVVATGILPGLGSNVQAYERINSKIFSAISSIPSVRGVEIGDGEFVSSNIGSLIADNIVYDNYNNITRETNYSGGIEGGITNGMPIVVTAKSKSIPSFKRNIKTINFKNMEETYYSCTRRSDICVVSNCATIAESELAFVLANEYLKKFGCDSMDDILNSVDAYKNRIKKITNGG